MFVILQKFSGYVLGTYCGFISSVFLMDLNCSNGIIWNIFLIPVSSISYLIACIDVDILAVVKSLRFISGTLA